MFTGVYFPTQVRLLLFPGIHCLVLGRGGGHWKCRVLFNNSGNTCHHCCFVICVLLRKAGDWSRHGSHYRKYLTSSLRILIGLVDIFQAIYVAALGYFGFKLFRMWFGPTSRIDDYLPARRSLTTFAIITIILLVTTIIIASICTSKFGKGLFDRQNDRDLEEIPMNTTHQRPPNRRIALDA